MNPLVRELYQLFSERQLLFRDNAPAKDNIWISERRWIKCL